MGCGAEWETASRDCHEHAHQENAWGMIPLTLAANIGDEWEGTLGGRTELETFSQPFHHFTQCQLTRQELPGWGPETQTFVSRVLKVFAFQFYRSREPCSYFPQKPRGDNKTIEPFRSVQTPIPCAWGLLAFLGGTCSLS